MKRWFLIDGYNLLHAWGLLRPRVGPQGLEKARDQLIQILAHAFAAEAHRVTIVFDAPRSRLQGTSTQTVQGLQIRFASSSQEADDLIEELLDCHSSPKQVVVVSEDHRLKQAAKKRKAVAMNSEEFRKELVQRRRQQFPKEEEAKPVEEPQAEDLLEKFREVEADPRWKEFFREF